jgi:hypothetical protein
VAFVEGLEFFSEAVQRLSPAEWQRASPCANWQALDVLGHVGTAVAFGTKLLGGEQPAWAPADPPRSAVHDLDIAADAIEFTRTVIDPFPPSRYEARASSLPK